MRSLILSAAILALAVARPETYRETEDFKYSRSSSDEGSKSGYYGAQRGNVGGNYERAHNMDTSAQVQMSSAIKQVESGIGDISNSRVGDVFTSGNTKGIHSQGYQSLENLQGRNFQEGGTYDDSLSQSHNLYGNTHSSLHNSAYGGAYSGYNEHQSGFSKYETSEKLQRANEQHANSAYLGSYANQGRYIAPHRSSGYGAQNLHSSQYSSHENVGTSSAQGRLINAAPVKIVVRPGSTVNVPVGAEVYGNNHIYSNIDEQSINKEAELINDHVNLITERPVSGSKFYESSYKYKKEWEKREEYPGVMPLAITTSTPFISNSELVNDHDNADFYYKGYDSAASKSSRYQSTHNSQQQVKSGFNKFGYDSPQSGRLTTGIESGKPKSYQSSYSYHKAWERQGDPYVIQPVSGQVSEKLMAEANNQQVYGSLYNQGSHSNYHAGGVDCDCDEPGYIRKTRSVDSYHDQQQSDRDFHHSTRGGLTNQAYKQQSDDLQQSSQNRLSNLENLDHTSQTKWSDSDDLSQQAHQGWSQPENDRYQQDRIRRPYHHHRSNQVRGQTELSDTLHLGQHRSQEYNRHFNQQDRPLGKYHNHQFRDNLNQQAQTEFSEADDLEQQAQHGW